MRLFLPSLFFGGAWGLGLWVERSSFKDEVVLACFWGGAWDLGVRGLGFI